MSDQDEEQRRYQDRHYHTSRIGETCRYIGFGLLIVYYVTLSADTQTFSATIRECAPFLLFEVGAFGALTVLADYFHYVCGYMAAERAINRKDGVFKYKEGWPSYILADSLFKAKQWFAAIGAAFLIAMVGFYLAR